MTLEEIEKCRKHWDIVRLGKQMEMLDWLIQRVKELEANLAIERYRVKELLAQQERTEHILESAKERVKEFEADRVRLVILQEVIMKLAGRDKEFRGPVKKKIILTPEEMEEYEKAYLT